MNGKCIIRHVNVSEIKLLSGRGNISYEVLGSKNVTLMCEYDNNYEIFNCEGRYWIKESFSSKIDFIRPKHVAYPHKSAKLHAALLEDLRKNSSTLFSMSQNLITQHQNQK